MRAEKGLRGTRPEGNSIPKRIRRSEVPWAQKTNALLSAVLGENPRKGSCPRGTRPTVPPDSQNVGKWAGKRLRFRIFKHSAAVIETGLHEWYSLV